MSASSKHCAILGAKNKVIDDIFSALKEFIVQ